MLNNNDEAERSIETWINDVKTKHGQVNKEENTPVSESDKTEVNDNETKLRSLLNQVHDSKQKVPSLNIDITDLEPFDNKSTFVGAINTSLTSLSARNKDWSKHETISKVERQLGRSQILRSGSATNRSTNKIKGSANNNISINIVLNNDKEKSATISNSRMVLARRRSADGKFVKEDNSYCRGALTCTNKSMMKKEANKWHKKKQDWFEKTRIGSIIKK